MHRDEFEQLEPALAQLGRAKLGDPGVVLVGTIRADAVASTLGWRPEPGRFHLFRVDIEEVSFLRWDSSTNDQFVTRWPARVEFVRRGTSATSLSDPEPFHELLA